MPCTEVACCYAKWQWALEARGCLCSPRCVYAAASHAHWAITRGRVRDGAQAHAAMRADGQLCALPDRDAGAAANAGGGVARIQLVVLGYMFSLPTTHVTA